MDTLAMNYDGSNFDPNPGLFFTHVSGATVTINSASIDQTIFPRTIVAGSDPQGAG